MSGFLICASHAVDYFAQIVRRNIRRNADGDARRAVDQKVRKARRQKNGFFQRVVEVQRERHGVFVDIAQHFQCERTQARFGISHCGGGVAVDRAKVAVPVDEHHAHGKILCQTHERVVHGSVSVRVIFTEAVADDTRALAMGLVRPKRQFVHRV